MLTLLFFVLFFAVFGKVFTLGLKLGWGLLKFFFGLVFLPVVILVLFLGGLISFGIPILLIIGAVVLLESMKS